ncbi:MAG: hypothetical protein EB059_04595 [Alphaproteobacteria bacterium]|nr:hypothetical protein [Alphaproteobacteria bacterium]
MPQTDPKPDPSRYNYRTPPRKRLTVIEKLFKIACFAIGAYADWKIAEAIGHPIGQTIGRVVLGKILLKNILHPVFEGTNDLMWPYVLSPVGGAGVVLGNIAKGTTSYAVRGIRALARYVKFSAPTPS